MQHSYSLKIILALFFLFIYAFIFLTPNTVSAQWTSCTNIIMGVGYPPCDTRYFNLDCSVADTQDPFSSSNYTGTQCANNRNQDCVQSNSTFGWSAERCDRATTFCQPNTYDPRCTDGNACTFDICNAEGTACTYINVSSGSVCERDGTTFEPTLCCNGMDL